MKRTMLFAVVALAGLLFCASARAGEPKYEGKPLSYWMERLRKCENDKEREELFQVLYEFGPNAAPAVPALVEMLDDHSAYFRMRVGKVLCEIGPAAKSAVPALVESLKEKKARSPKVVIQILGKIGPDAKEAVPVLLAAMDDDALTDAAVEALCTVGPAKDVFPAVRKVVRARVTDPEWLYRENKLPPLEMLGGEAVPLLIELLDHKEARVKSFSAEALGKIGPAAKDSVPVLTKALSDDRMEVRQKAAFSLWLIDKNTAGVAVLAAILKEQSKENTYSGKLYYAALQAMEMLGEIGPAAKSALPELRSLLEYPVLNARWAAEKAIDKIDTEKSKKDDKH